MRMNYPNTYFTRTAGTWSDKTTSKAGWTTNQVTKPLMIDELARAIRTGDLEVWDEATISEMKTYVREPDGKRMHGSPHDDRVMSLAIANQMRSVAFIPEYRQKTNEYGTLDWWSNQIEKPRRGVLIGHHQRESA